MLYNLKRILVQTAQASNLYYMSVQEHFIFYCSAAAPYYLEPECERVHRGLSRLDMIILG